MELHPLDPLGLARPDPADAGWTQAIRRGEPLSAEQVLGRGLQAMLDEDQAEAERADPIAYAAAQRRRSSLFWRLFGRR
jgi:hypothetical protein